MLKTNKKCKENLFQKILKKVKILLYIFSLRKYNMRVIKRNAQRFRLVTFNSSSFSPLSYMDRAQNRKALRPIHVWPGGVAAAGAPSAGGADGKITAAGRPGMRQRAAYGT